MPDRISHLLRFSDLSVRDVSPAYIEEKVLVKISLENFEGKLEKFSDIGDVAGVIAVRKSKQFLEITIFQTEKTLNLRTGSFFCNALYLGRVAGDEECGYSSRPLCDSTKGCVVVAFDKRNRI